MKFFIPFFHNIWLSIVFFFVFDQGLMILVYRITKTEESSKLKKLLFVKNKFKSWLLSSIVSVVVFIAVIVACLHKGILCNDFKYFSHSLGSGTCSGHDGEFFNYYALVFQLATFFGSSISVFLQAITGIKDQTKADSLN